MGGPIQFSKKKDGGSATDGVSRAAFNKICLEYFDEGMRKPARNGNPGSLESGLAQQRRHFLRGRWRDPQSAADMSHLKNMWANMAPEQAAASRALLEDFSRWKPGPAGRGGERLSRKRGSEEEGGSENEFESGDNHSPYPPGGAWDVAAAMPGKVDVLASHAPIPVGPPPRKRTNTREVHSKRDMPHAGRMDGPGPLELLCNVAFNSDHMGQHHMSPDHGHGILEPHSLGHDADLAAERLVKGSLGNGWHPHDLESSVELGPPNLALREDELALQEDEAHARHHPHHYPPHPHPHPLPHPMHRMSVSVGMDYGHAHPAHPAHLHHPLAAYGGHHHMREGHRIGEGPRDLRGEMLPPHSHRAPAPHLEGAWDSPSAQYNGPGAQYNGPGRVGGLPPTHPGHMRPSPRHGPMSHKSPRHAPMPHPGMHSAAPGPGPMPHSGHVHHSPRHGPMPHKSPRHMPMAHAGKSPRHAPMGGHPSEMRGEMLPPSANASWMKSPGLSHMKPKKIPGRSGALAFARCCVLCQCRSGEWQRGTTGG